MRVDCVACRAGNVADYYALLTEKPELADAIYQKIKEKLAAQKAGVASEDAADAAAESGEANA